MGNSWRIIDAGLCTAAFNMAIDEAIAIEVRRHISPPTLRIYSWQQRAVSIGHFQRAGDLDLGYCLKNDIQIVRRPTGGRAVYHNDEITYSFSVQTGTGIFSHGLFDSYKKISVALALALSKCGLSPQSRTRKPNPKFRVQNSKLYNPLCFQSVSYGEISVDKIKVIGSAQKRWADGLLQQGSIPFTVDENEIMELFQINRGPMSKEPLIGLKQISSSLSHDELKYAMRNAFEETFQIEFVNSAPSQKEIVLAQELEEQKYLNDAWTFRR
jgi:lipoyl(octanoyl) transferase